MKSRKISVPSLRWSLLATWPVGYALTYPALPGFALQYCALSLLALLACGLLLFKLEKPLVDSLPVWIILLIFTFGYYIEFYLIVLDPSILDSFFAPTKVTHIDVAAFFNCYLATTSAFVAVSLASLFYLEAGSAGPERFIELDYVVVDDKVLWQLSTIFGLIILLSSMLAYQFNLIGSGDRDLLPLHLEGVIDYFRVVTAPLLAVLLIQLASLGSRRSWVIAGVAMLLAFALSDMILRTSKGTFVTMALVLIFLRVIAGKRPSRKQVGGGLILILVGILFFPIFLVFRTFRTQGMGIEAALSSSIQQLLALGEMPAALTYLYRILVLRLTGAGALLAITLRHVRPLGMATWDTFWGPRSWTGYINLEVFGVSPQYVDYFGIAPSLVGLFYVLGGVAGAAIGAASLWSLMLFGWRQLGKLGKALGPASRAVYLEMMLWVVMDGNATLQLGKELAVFAFSILAAYCLCRFGLLGSLVRSPINRNQRSRPATVGA